MHVLFKTDINPYLESRNLCKFCAVKDIHEIQLYSWVWSPALHSGTGGRVRDNRQKLK